MSDSYSAVLTGKLKLKGVKDSKVDKKKKKTKPKPSSAGEDARDFTDKSVMLSKLEEEDAQITKEGSQDLFDGTQMGTGANLGNADEAVSDRTKTEAERRFDEQRRKRLDERLKREGVKTHKQRVEELNRYLSGLSEHHDMPRIGPG